MIVSATVLVLLVVSAPLLLRSWYRAKIACACEKLRAPRGCPVPGPRPRTLFGNLLEVYRAENRLSVYHDFHRRHGRVIQIFWMWRSQLSVADYRLAARILFSRQKNYRKYLNRLQPLRRLFGASILTRQGQDSIRDRQLFGTTFSNQATPRYHEVFMERGQALTSLWTRALPEHDTTLRRDIYPDMQALFLDTIGQVALGRDFGALRGELAEFIKSIDYILAQSIRPSHAFIPCWHRLPTPARAKAERAFHTIDAYLFRLIQDERDRARGKAERHQTLLARLLRTSSSDQAIRDTLVAIISNGHENPATSMALSMALLATHPDELAKLQTELDQALQASGGILSQQLLEGLPYHDWVLQESLRLYPPVAGLNRIALADDVVAGWTIPAGQEIGIALMPLHRDPRYYGDNATEFRPGRFRNGSLRLDRSLHGNNPASLHKCSNPAVPSDNHSAAVHAPLSFGAGTRKCPAQHFALQAMKTVLAILVREFEWQAAPGFTPEVEIRNHGLAPTACPKNGVPLLIRRRTRQPAVDVPSQISGSGMRDSTRTAASSSTIA